MGNTQMKIFDMHIHCKSENPKPEKLIESMEKAAAPETDDSHTWLPTELNLKYQLPRSSLAKTVQKEMANGKKFHETLGVIVK